MNPCSSGSSRFVTPSRRRVVSRRCARQGAAVVVVAVAVGQAAEDRRAVAVVVAAAGAGTHTVRRPLQHRLRHRPPAVAAVAAVARVR